MANNSSIGRYFSNAMDAASNSSRGILATKVASSMSTRFRTFTPALMLVISVLLIAALTRAAEPTETQPSSRPAMKTRPAEKGAASRPVQPETPATAPAWFGCLAIPLTPDLRKSMVQDGFPSAPSGLLVLEVACDSPAEKGGLWRWDIIHAVGGKPVLTPEDFFAARKLAMPGQPVTFDVSHSAKNPVNDRYGPWRRHQIKVAPLQDDPSVGSDGSGKTMPCPLMIVEAAMLKNRIGTPQIAVRVFNRTNKPVTAYKLNMQLLDRFDEAATLAGNASDKAIAQDTIGPLSRGEMQLITLHLRRNASKAVLRVDRVKLADGTEWTADPDSEGLGVKVEISQ
jgi:hypothetical protein